MKASKINIQIWDKVKYPNAKYWSDIPHTSHEVSNPGEFARNIRASTGYSVRMTYHLEGVSDVSRLNGAYF